MKNTFNFIALLFVVVLALTVISGCTGAALVALQ